MIKKRTRPQPRIREPSPDLSDSDAQQQANNEDEAELPYVLGALLRLPFSALFLLFPPNAHPSATVSPNCSSFENFVVRDRASMRPN